MFIYGYGRFKDLKEHLLQDDICGKDSTAGAAGSSCSSKPPPPEAKHIPTHMSLRPRQSLQLPNLLMAIEAANPLRLLLLLLQHAAAAAAAGGGRAGYRCWSIALVALMLWQELMLVAAIVVVA